MLFFLKIFDHVKSEPVLLEQVITGDEQKVLSGTLLIQIRFNEQIKDEINALCLSFTQKHWL